jgi:molybdopterin synthase sulfur carrier subunit
MIRVVLPAHLRSLARVDDEVTLDLDGQATLRSVLDALEARYPMLRGTIRDHVTHQRRSFVRFFACEEDLSHEPPDTLLPEAVATGVEPFQVEGAMAGGSVRLGSPGSSWVLMGSTGFYWVLLGSTGVLPVVYSARKVIAGSTRDARHAGTQHASVDTTSSSAITPA